MNTDVYDRAQSEKELTYTFGNYSHYQPEVKYEVKNVTQSAGFEPARAEPN